MITTMKVLNKILLPALLIGSLSGCTNLDEELYSTIGADNYYHKASDVERMAYRPFEHAFWTVQARMMTNEYTADQLVTLERDGRWRENGYFSRLLSHNLDPTIALYPGEYGSCFQGICECNFSIEELQRLNPADFGFSRAQFDELESQNRVLRAWLYIRVLDAFRNIPLLTKFTGATVADTDQVPPEQVFNFIESELLDCMDKIGQKEALGTQASIEGRWTKAGVAALLVRLYLNAEIYIGVDRYADCEKYAQKILDGEYGPYAIGDRWDEIFDWDNDTSDEMIFGFPAAGGYTYWGYQGYTYWNTVPAGSNPYFGDESCNAGTHDCRWAVAPSFAPDGSPYNYTLGRPVEKFRKYPGDYRLLKYRNLGNGRREGMFVYGYLEYEKNGETQQVLAYGQNYPVYLRDAVGQFGAADPDTWPGGSSDISNADNNSGYGFVKYPFYPDTEKQYQLEADFAEIRLPEIIYSLAECKLRKGQTDEAAKLLNSVRRRNYPKEIWEQNLYDPEGKAKLDMDEMLDEWGREFFAEGRRRIDLIRFDKYTSGTWWGKSPDPDRHCEIFPFTQSELKQNPGY